MHERLEQWCFEELNKLLGSPSEEIVRYVLDIQNREELEEFLEDLFGHLSSDVRDKFMNDMLEIRQKIQTDMVLKEKISSVRKEVNPNVYRNSPDISPSTTGPLPTTTKDNTNGGKSKHKGKNRKSQEDFHVTNGNSHVMLDPLLAPPAPRTEISPSGSTKQRRSGNFVPLYDTSQVVLLPGRHPCFCQASQHALINNCIQCGRIVCQQEGSGPCFTCSALVCTPEEQEVLNRCSKKSEKLLNQLTSAPDQELLRKAVEHKNKLLEYNITAAQRTKVIDDESDYFSLSSSNWISEEERKALKKKEKEQHEQKHATKYGNKYKVKLDFADRTTALDDDFRTTGPQFETPVLQNRTRSEQVLVCRQELEDNSGQDVHPLLTVLPPVYEPGDFPALMQQPPKTGELTERPGNFSRLQDRELQELSDQGCCLSMHQPWASLLVRGIKIHEGRTWYTAYRGPLWIHSGSKQPLKEDITEAEIMYHKIHENEDLEFPKQYPASCLLGCVNMVDCLQQEEYRRQFTDGESLSPYVFICESPQELIIKIPMSGKHKIFKMDPNLHRTVKKALKKFN